MTKEELAGQAETVVARALRLGAESAEAFVLDSRSGSVHLQKNDLAGVESGTSHGIGIRVLKEERVGFAYVSSVTQASEGIRTALDASRLSKRLPDFSFPGPRKVSRVSGLVDRRIEALGGDDVIERAFELVRAVHDVHPKLTVSEAGLSFGTSRAAVANSEGLVRSDRSTSVSASCFVVQSEVGVSTGFAGQDSTRLDLDLPRLGKEAADLAMRARRPKKLETAGRREIVLRPEPTADLLTTITVPSVYGKAAHRDESYYSGKVGRAVAHPKFSLIDDPTAARGLGSGPFDDEGAPSRPFAPIRRGRLQGYLFDEASAAEYGARSTASAVRVHAFDGRSYKSPPTISGRNLRLEATTQRAEKLVAGVDDGLWVHDLLGVHTANLVSGDFSVTSSLLFRIRKGAIEGPVAPISIAGNFHEALRRGVTLGDDVKPIGAEVAIATPSLRYDGFTVTP